MSIISNNINMVSELCEILEINPERVFSVNLEFIAGEISIVTTKSYVLQTEDENLNYLLKKYQLIGKESK